MINIEPAFITRFVAHVLFVDLPINWVYVLGLVGLICSWIVAHNFSEPFVNFMESDNDGAVFFISMLAVLFWPATTLLAIGILELGWPIILTVFMVKRIKKKRGIK